MEIDIDMDGDLNVDKEFDIHITINAYIVIDISTNIIILSDDM